MRMMKNIETRTYEATIHCPASTEIVDRNLKPTKGCFEMGYNSAVKVTRIEEGVTTEMRIWCIDGDWMTGHKYYSTAKNS